MKKYIIAAAITVILAVIGVTVYLLSEDKSSAQAMVPVNTGVTNAAQNAAQSPDTFDKQFQNTDGTINKTATSSYIDKEITAAAAQLKSLPAGSEERIKAKRRLNMLTALKQKMVGSK